MTTSNFSLNSWAGGITVLPGVQKFFNLESQVSRVQAGQTLPVSTQLNHDYGTELVRQKKYFKGWPETCSSHLFNEDLQEKVST